ncbi:MULTISPECIES: hypothetical protein [Halorussus]|nr:MULTISPECIES: hypothetical protein [Halorussus]
MELFLGGVGGGQRRLHVMAYPFAVVIHQSGEWRDLVEVRPTP